MSAVALTDHNTVDGLPDFIAAAKGKNIEIVTGIEFSTDYNGREIHVLGMFIAPSHFSMISELMKKSSSLKEASNIALVDSLNRAGYDIDYSAIKSSTPNGRINRAHIASALVKKGYASSTKECFDTLLSPDAGHYIEPERLSSMEIIEFISSINAVSVLAHPFLNLSEKELIQFLKEAKKHGLDGMECYYSAYTENYTNISLEIARKFELICSGGSDFHGLNKPDIKLGFGKGNLLIPFDSYAELKKKQRFKQNNY